MLSGGLVTGSAWLEWLLFFSPFLFIAAPATYGSSQARG